MPVLGEGGGARTGGQRCWPRLPQPRLAFLPRRGRWFRPLHRCPKLGLPAQQLTCKDSSPCGSRGVCLPHMPLGKLGLSFAGWGGGRCRPSGHREGNGAPWGGVWWGGSWNLEKPTPTLDSHPTMGLKPSSCQHRAVQGPGFAKRELWIVHSLTPGGGLLVGLLPSVSSPVGGGGLRPTRCRPR